MVSIVALKMLPCTLRWLFTLSPEEKIYSRCHVYVALGEIAEFYRLARHERFGPVQPGFPT